MVKDYLIKVIAILLVAMTSAFSFWLFWWPVRLFFFSLIPMSATYAWVGKVIIIFILGSAGGFWIPFLILTGGLAIISNHH